jgi:hypothetical protein
MGTGAPPNQSILAYADAAFKSKWIVLQAALAVQVPNIRFTA